MKCCSRAQWCVSGVVELFLSLSNFDTFMDASQCKPVHTESRHVFNSINIRIRLNECLFILHIDA